MDVIDISKYLDFFFISLFFFIFNILTIFFLLLFYYFSIDRPQTFILSNLIIVWQVAERLPSFASKLKARLNADISSGMVDILINAAILAIATFILFPLYWSRMLPEQNGSIYSGGSCWADLPFHMAVVNAFLTGRNQDVSFTDMHSPVFAGEKFSYPFIPDFHAAILVKQGLSIRWAFLLPGMFINFSYLSYIN